MKIWYVVLPNVGEFVVPDWSIKELEKKFPVKGDEYKSRIERDLVLDMEKEKNRVLPKESVLKLTNSVL